jgi:hypothetical protein
MNHIDALSARWLSARPTAAQGACLGRRRASHRAWATVAVLAGLAWPALAADAPPADPTGLPAELDALELADRAPEVATRPDSPWRIFGELAAGRATKTEPGIGAGTRRASLDLRYDGPLAPGWRAVLSNRLDLADRSGQSMRDVNTLREAYLGWAWTDTRAFEAGRINVRHGAGIGFNPTDFFRDYALRSVVSPDPAVLRENRQGTVGLQFQQLWSSGSLTALYSPDLGRRPTDDAYSLDLGATNASERWLMVLGQRLGGGVSSQFLVHGGEDVSTQVGANFSVALGESTVAYVEIASGRGPSLRAEALGTQDAHRTRHRSAFGLTYTTAFNLSLTFEGQTSDAGLSGNTWDALAPLDRAAVLLTADALQDLPARRAVFVYLQWKDLGWPGLDLSGYVRRESATRSRDQWLELRYRWGQSQDVTLQWQQYSGRSNSIYGSVPQLRAVELVLRRYF